MSDEPTEDHNHAFERSPIDGNLHCAGCGAWIDEHERKLMNVRAPSTVRLEHYTPTGWVTHTPVALLLFPERYPERLELHLKYGRAVELGPDLKPTGRKWEPRKLPPRSSLVPTDTPAWGLPNPERRGMCRHCDTYHGDPFDGRCLL